MAPQGSGGRFNGVCWYVPVLDFDRLEEGRSLALDVRAEARPGVAHHHVNRRHVRPRLRLWLQTPGLVHGARALVPAGETKENHDRNHHQGQDPFHASMHLSLG